MASITQGSAPVLDIYPPEKNEVEHIETSEPIDSDLTLEGVGLYKSRFDELSIPRTLWVFKRVVLVVSAVYTGYMCEGFEVSFCQSVGWFGAVLAEDHSSVPVVAS